jgi:hypothetical protein
VRSGTSPLKTAHTAHGSRLEANFPAWSFCLCQDFESGAGNRTRAGTPPAPGSGGEIHQAPFDAGGEFRKAPLLRC